MHKNQNGFTPVEGLLIILVVGVLGFGGYYVYDKITSKEEPAASVSQNQVEQSESQSGRFTSKLWPDFSIILPDGWTAKDPAKYDEDVFGPGWVDGIIEATDGKTTLYIEMSTVRATGYESYNCFAYPDLAKVEDYIYRFTEKQDNLMRYQRGISASDPEWATAQEGENTYFDDQNPNYCVEYPYIGTYTSTLKSADYPERPYGFNDGYVMANMFASVKGDTSAAQLAKTDEIIKSRSDSATVN